MRTMARHRAPEPPLFEANFEAFYVATSSGTYAAIHRLAAGDEYLARDVVQEAYLAMGNIWSVRRGRTAEDNRKLVLRIAVNKLFDVYRARRVPEVELNDDVITLLAEEVTFDELSVLRPVRELLARQPPRRRAVGVLFFLEGLTDQEIAEILGISPSTVRTQIERLSAVFEPHRDLVRRAHQADPHPPAFDVEAGLVDLRARASTAEPYAMTGGRTLPSSELRLEALISTVEGWRGRGVEVPEHRRIAELCERATALAELAALLPLPVGAVRILVSDLADRGVVRIHEPDDHDDGGPKPATIERVLRNLDRP
ncbi:sigma-70 family RNA polymerase sigma factor [Amycolatopsis umgeniensis]|uniref:RNA polymerase sigma factor (Sigma-70 family) n=1 Tax=Amycolatopsis umgeniensis TaxID=336628 RepID=A0A841BBW3_9PSEU|nr:sigma-70 family RNA polymerase sigma factor [Amycolatopsis umgeniensis]MBB5858319.1 RNA polymerase sigma factor (sigma-70 family) [Amycolatopsis umgeniensis]